MNIIGKKHIYFIISLVIIIPGVISLLMWGLNLSIEFKGGSRMTLLFPDVVQEKTITQIKQIYQQDGIIVATVQTSGNQLIVRTAPLDQKTHQKILEDIQKKSARVKEDSFETVGPTI